MEKFDDLIDRISAFPEDSAARSEALDAEAMAFSFGPHAGRGVVLQRSAALELGADGRSCGMILPTGDSARVVDGRISVFGPNAEDLIAAGDGQGPSQAPFGQVILVAGPDIEVADLSAFEDCLYTKDYIEGYFVRSSEGRVHSRIARKLADAGFGFRELGSVLMLMVKEACPSAESVEVVFVTESGVLLDELTAMRSDWLSRMHDARKDLWLEKGLDIDCPAGGHCGQCADKDLCDSVRKIARIRRKGE